MGLKLPIMRNKKNNQLVIFLPRKKLKVKKKRVPKFIEFNNIKLT